MILIRKIRSKLNISQRELAAKLVKHGLNATQARISHYENTRRELPTRFAYAYINIAKESGDIYTLEDFYLSDKQAA